MEAKGVSGTHSVQPERVGALLAGLLPVALLSLILGLVLVHASWSTFRARGDETPPSRTGSPLAARCGCKGRT